MYEHFSYPILFQSPSIYMQHPRSQIKKNTPLRTSKVVSTVTTKVRSTRRLSEAAAPLDDKTAKLLEEKKRKLGDALLKNDALTTKYEALLEKAELQKSEALAELLKLQKEVGDATNEYLYITTGNKKYKVQIKTRKESRPVNVARAPLMEELIEKLTELNDLVALELITELTKQHTTIGYREGITDAVIKLQKEIEAKKTRGKATKKGSVKEAASDSEIEAAIKKLKKDFKPIKDGAYKLMDLYTELLHGLRSVNSVLQRIS